MISDLRAFRHRKGWSATAVSLHNHHIAHIRSLPECGKLDMSPMLHGLVKDGNKGDFFLLDQRGRKDVVVYMGNDWGKLNYLREEGWG